MRGFPSNRLLAWVVHAFFDSFGIENNIWAGSYVTGSEANDYFQNRIIGMETLDATTLKPTRIVWENVGCSLFTWAAIFLCIVFGIKWTGRITYFTMGFPILLLFIMLGRSVTLEGADEGIRQYLSSDWSVLVDKPEVWSKAVTQIFFSIGIAFGIMTAYGSHCRRDEPAVLNSSVIAVSNSLFSFVAGFAVFATLGHLAHIEDTSIEDLHISGVGLIFGSWPVVLGTLPGGQHWIRLLFVMLFLLGLDSAFSFLEGFLICLADTAFFGGIDKKYLSLGLTFVAWLFSFLYATDAGLIFLDSIDYYLNFVILLVGFAKCFSAGWVYNLDEQVDNLGASIVFSYMATTFGSLFFACILWFSISDGRSALIAGFVGLAIFYSVGMAFVCYLMNIRKRELGMWSWSSMFYDLTLRNVVDLKDDLSGVVGHIPIVWAVLIKHVIPPVLLVLFFVGCAATTSTGQTEFGHYGGYPLLPYQLLGILTVVFAGFIVTSGIFAPRLYDAFKKQNSPIPSKDATIRVSPAGTVRESGASKSIEIAPSAWPPRSIDIEA
jgi:SNF family Na+-dependent transporter